jgi:hypothetical protein
MYIDEQTYIEKFQLKEVFISSFVKKIIFWGKNAKQQTKNHVKSHSKLYFLIYVLMWCPFNGMLIMEKCAL